MAIPPGSGSYPTNARSSDNTLDKLGTVAISRCSPSNPSADLAVTIGELFKDGIPAIIGSTLKQWRGLSNRARRKAIGKEYLNQEFGWKPLVNDLLKISFAIVDAHAILGQYERDSGKLVRRSYAFPTTQSDTFTTVSSNAFPWNSPSGGALNVIVPSGAGKVIAHDHITRRQWFSGAFTYYVPPPGGLRNDIARNVIQARKLFGLSLTPDTLWNLAPWSWAVDWFTNTSELLHNWTDWAIDNQVLVYGYMMEHSFASRSYTFVGNTRTHPLDTVPNSVSYVTETKLRRPGTPYGFGLDPRSFSARQVAIVSALGLSRSR